MEEAERKLLHSYTVPLANMKKMLKRIPKRMMRAPRMSPADDRNTMPLLPTVQGVMKAKRSALQLAGECDAQLEVMIGAVFKYCEILNKACIAEHYAYHVGREYEEVAKLTNAHKQESASKRVIQRQQKEQTDAKFALREGVKRQMLKRKLGSGSNDPTAMGNTVFDL